MEAWSRNRIRFESAQGQTLAARLDRPAGPIRGYALFAHCFTCSKDIAAATRIARGLASEGLAVLRFDFTGLGHSEGEFGNTGFSSNIDDLVAAAAWMRRELEAPSLLIGHSLGGAAVLAAAERIPEVRAVATLGAPFDPGHATHLFGPKLAEIEREGEAEVELAGRSFRIGRGLVEDLQEQPQAERIARLNRALLVMHAPHDSIVGIDNAARIYAAAQHPKSFVSLDDADHLLTRPADAHYAAQVLSAWAARFLPDPEEPEAPDALEPSEVVVRESGHGKFVQLVQAGRHALLADEPRKVGGEDAGPTPYGYLLSALGSCTAMTLRMYADRKEWPLEGVKVHLKHRKGPPEDAAAHEAGTGARMVDHIDRELELVGPLDEAQRARLLEIADRCPVHRTLEGEVAIHTSLEA